MKESERIHAWIVVQHYDVHVIDSDYLENEITGSRQYDVVDHFYTFILQVFNISRSAATVINTPNHPLNNSLSDGGSSGISDGDGSVVSDSDGSIGSDGDGSDISENQSNSNNGQEPGRVSATLPQTAASSDHSSTGSSEGDDVSVGSNVRSSLSTVSDSSRSAVQAGSGRTTFIRRRNQSISDLISQFTTAPPVGSLLAMVPGRRRSSIAPSRSRTGSSSRSGHDRISSSSSNNNRNNSNNSNGKRINGITSSNSGRKNPTTTTTTTTTNTSSSGSSTIQVLVSLASGQSMELTLPSLTSFEEAFERRLSTTGYDISADDPFHQLKQDVPTFRDLFPQPLPRSSLALSASSAPSSGNPFFQAFGSPTSTSFTRQTRPLPTTTGMRQTFSSGFGTGGRGTNRGNQFGDLGGRFGQASHQTIGGFPSSGDIFQRPSINTRFTGTSIGFPASSGSGRDTFSNSRNAFQRLGANTPLSGGQFPQLNNDRNSLGFLSNRNFAPILDTNAAFTGGSVGSLFSSSQRNPFGNVNTPPTLTAFRNTDLSRTGSRSGFPDTSSLFGRFSQAARTNQITQGFGTRGALNSNGFRSNGRTPQNTDFGFVPMPTSANRFSGQQIPLIRQPTLGGDVFSGRRQGNSLFGQLDNSWNRGLPQQFLSSSAGRDDSTFPGGSPAFPNRWLGQFPGGSPFSLSTTPRNHMVSFTGNRPSTNTFFSGTGTTGFQPRSSSTNLLTGNFPTSSTSLFGRTESQFSNHALPMNGDNWNQGGALNSFAPNVMQSRGGGIGRPFNPLLRNDWFNAGSVQQNVGSPASSLFPRRFTSRSFSAG
ncbi:uncharacterized protein LOC143287185 [Babylonia areolata]|uniref:uncharacterized protein LOC143287185 n=1 Tax=Babylonia areolata TaxID=304850 RepID=UPI003FD33A38